MTDTRCLYVVASAAPPVRSIDELLAGLHAARWQACVILTPTAASWVDVERLAASGVPVRSRPRLPWESDPLPAADAVLAAPATFNTVNKWAAGITDTLAVGILCELLGAGVPTMAVPCAKADLRKHSAYRASVERLTDAGVQFLDPDDVTYRGDDGLAAFDWPAIAAFATSGGDQVRDPRGR